ncbi:ADP-ribosylation factor-like protein 14 [Megalops cyprinoides]|uniref:ADP-ribosylation factor-like protein 14 n=1 Tax=Megalops cyprinoides TaxID=118141 RepID=UPI00186436B7|nr:ADP-ribosylation factor-like protein 14 [Megalops cyprinoides]
MGQQGSKPPAEIRILILGLDGAGKSTLLYKLKYNEAVVTVPTIGFNVEMIETEKRATTLTVWDVGGQTKMRPHWQHYYEDTAGLVFVVDSSNKGRLDETKREFEHVLKSEHLKRIPVVILANKQDVPGAVSAAEITEMLNLKKTCGDRDWFVQPCSARTGMGLEEGFRRMVHFVKTPLLSMDDNIKDTVNHLKSKTITAVTMKQGQNCC